MVEFAVRGRLVRCPELVATCTKCGREVYVPEVNDENVKIRETAFDNAHDM